jgi:hypothetical protein
MHLTVKSPARCKIRSLNERTSSAKKVERCLSSADRGEIIAVSDRVWGSCHSSVGLLHPAELGHEEKPTQAPSSASSTTHITAKILLSSPPTAQLLQNIP